MTRIAVIEKDKCHPAECGNYLCIRVCPVNRTGDECIVKGDDKKAHINTELCTGCGICPKRCPFDAINIINLPEELDKNPIHRFGENGFHLYNLPVPMFGKVVGILGRNGIGKSTAMKILAGVLKPNLGKDDEATFNELIEYFKGTEAQTFFEKQKQKDIKISYKPQAVNLIPKHAKGTVRQLLEKADEKGKLEEYSEELSLTKILDSDISKISGGELQRVAITASALKKANIYMFDEPTSFLDIKQRLKVSRFISSLADENTGVLIIEHDLIILDYMTDLIHIMYGKESCYGIVSQPKASRSGINTYLEGYLKEENMLFRDKPIRFEPHPPFEQIKKEKITSWHGIHKELGRFILNAPKGEIFDHSVCGVLGENGIGKTSLIRILAGESKPDKGMIEDKVSISYKPQYIDSESDDLVMTRLQEAIKKYEVQLIRPLNIKPLMMKKIRELSGGELQKVAITECLSNDAELYLLDEPSAFLDVEQRLMVSKTLRNLMINKGASALVIDHDLLFVDYLSDTIMVFEGQPAVEGIAKGPFSMEAGMNNFLGDIKMTFRRDPETNRPRANKLDSQIDRKQKSENKLYYTESSQ